MRNITVKVHPSKANLKKKDQLAWKIAEIASDKAKINKNALEMVINRIIDNALEPTDRNLFYMFQDYDLLTTESEETTLWDGREWRIHYWKFKPDLKERMESYMQRQRQPEEIDPFADIYGTDGRTIWTRESEKVANPNAFTSDW